MALRRECVEILRQAGFGPRRPGRACVVYVRFGRWLVRQSHWTRFVASGHASWRDLRRLRIVRFDSSPATEASELILIRESGRPKVGVFNIADRRKDVHLLHEPDYRRELEAIEWFSRGVVPVPPLLASDAAGKRYSQRLVCDPLAPAAPADLADAESVLMALAASAQVEYEDPDTFVSGTEAAIGQTASYLNVAVRTKLQQVLSQCRREFLPAFASGVPKTRCHGDYSLGNLLTGEDGRLYLNDFDRSFMAGPLFDAVYFGVTAQLPGKWVHRVVDELGHIEKLSAAVGSVDLMRYARAMAALDLVRFVRRRAVNLGAAPDAVCEYSIYVIEQLLKGRGASV